MIDDQLENIRSRVLQDLPGEVAQRRMAPSVRFTQNRLPNPKLTKESGVLIILYPDTTGLGTVLMERTTIGPHGGQISFPGGKREADDPSLDYTALREANEEVGVEKEKIELLGSLTKLFVPNSNFWIHPVIGYIQDKPEWIPNPEEVKSVIPVNLNYLFDDSIKKQKYITRNGIEIDAPYYDVFGHFVWGATAMIISEFEALMK